MRTTQDRIANHLHHRAKGLPLLNDIHQMDRLDRLIAEEQHLSDGQIHRVQLEIPTPNDDLLSERKPSRPSTPTPPTPPAATLTSPPKAPEASPKKPINNNPRTGATNNTTNNSNKQAKNVNNVKNVKPDKQSASPSASTSKALSKESNIANNTKQNPPSSKTLAPASPAASARANEVPGAGAVAHPETTAAKVAPSAKNKNPFDAISKENASQGISKLKFVKMSDLPQLSAEAAHIAEGRLLKEPTEAASSSGQGAVSKGDDVEEHKDRQPLVYDAAEKSALSFSYRNITILSTRSNMKYMHIGMTDY